MALDNKLVQLLVDEHTCMVEGFIPDLMDSMNFDDYNATMAEQDSLRDATQDCAADRIYDEEVVKRGGKHCNEFREAAKQIAEHFFGKK